MEATILIKWFKEPLDINLCYERTVIQIVLTHFFTMFNWSLWDNSIWITFRILMNSCFRQLASYNVMQVLDSVW